MNFGRIFGVRKLDSPGCHAALFFATVSLAVLIEHRLVTDGQTDRHRTKKINRTFINSKGKCQSAAAMADTIWDSLGI